ncbi:nuclear transport factor 2 family protein [Streptomyces sp. NPDC090442]|uniref:nuclear transport factor 2 family protein n=1 Tax=Streptomyces sp. NPDC090442 TaxID=3365962 RepID=UPI003807CC4A
MRRSSPQDVDALSEICHRELLYTHTNGATDTYESYLRKLREGAGAFHRIDHPAHRITVTGDTALVLGEMNADLTSNGQAEQLNNVTLAVWVRNGQTWKLLAFHPTPKS